MRFARVVSASGTVMSLEAHLSGQLNVDVILFETQTKSRIAQFLVIHWISAWWQNPDRHEFHCLARGQHASKGGVCALGVERSGFFFLLQIQTISFILIHCCSTAMVFRFTNVAQTNKPAYIHAHKYTWAFPNTDSAHTRANAQDNLVHRSHSWLHVLRHITFHTVDNFPRSLPGIRLALLDQHTRITTACANIETEILPVLQSGTQHMPVQYSKKRTYASDRR